MQLAQRVLVLVATFLWLLYPIQANDTEGPLANLSFLVGDWAGTGWVENPTDPESRTQLNRYYEVRYKLDGNLLVMENAVRNAPDVPRSFEKSMLSIVSIRGNSLGIRMYTVDGSTESLLNVKDKTVSWRVFEGDGRYVEYFIDVQKDAWNEICKRSTDNGETWKQVYAMTYRRVK